MRGVRQDLLGRDWLITDADDPHNLCTDGFVTGSGGFETPGRAPSRGAKEGEQQMLGADEPVPQLPRLRRGPIEDPSHRRSLIVVHRLSLPPMRRAAALREKQNSVPADYVIRRR